MAAADLAAGTHYYVTVDANAIQDLAGNAYAGISSSTAFDFTTAAAGSGTKAAFDFEGKVRNIPGLQDVSSDVLISSPRIVVNVDRDRASSLGVTVDQIENALYDAYHLPGMKEGQTKVRRDEGRHVRIAVLATHRFLEEFEGAAERLLAVCTDYMDLADRMVRRPSG